MGGVDPASREGEAAQWRTQRTSTCSATHSDLQGENMPDSFNLNGHKSRSKTCNGITNMVSNQENESPEKSIRFREKRRMRVTNRVTSENDEQVESFRLSILFLTELFG